MHGNTRVVPGETYGRLTIVEVSHRRNSRIYWLCRCSCGSTKAIASNKLRNGHTRSCGCLHREQLAERRRTHGMSTSPEYAVWNEMIARCTRPSSKGWQLYGGRGIKVCERWQKFVAFIEDMGPRPGPRYTVERVDNSGNYTPENCRWATFTEQARNTRKNRTLTAFGQTRTIAEWAEITGLKYMTLYQRVATYGWDTERALTTSAAPSVPAWSPGPP